ncbi:MAG TPA: GSCFA domain-containing protein [Bacteroidia bacterium]
MHFILPFSIKRFSHQLNVRQAMLLMGSCFAEEIGTKLRERKFNALINSHGILYNPISICNAITDYVQEKKYTQQDIFLHDELWRSFRHHGKFSDTDSATCLANINHKITQAHHQLKNARWLVLTFGSAFAYTQNNHIVANCHKIPSTQFKKVLLSKEQIMDAWQKQIKFLKEFNPELNIVFTVSPVRYVREGIMENNRSKGILFDTIHTLIEQNTNCFYFPAYEIVIDELRDYRFFKEDLVHPNQLAINYVWQKFTDAVCDEETKNFMADYEPILKSLQHRDLQQDTNATLKFKKQLEEKQAALVQKYPFMKSL